MLRFPDLATLQLALISGAVPPDVAETSAGVAVGDDGAVRVWPERALGRSALAALRRLGVESTRARTSQAERSVLCWAELLPTRPDPGSAQPGPTTPVVFDLPALGVAGLVGEILRLGNDRQAIRWLADEGGSQGEGMADRALVRVVGPPYFALLRAVDRAAGDATAPRAFTERAAGVFVEVGFAHPLADRIRLPPGRLVLIQASGEWVVLPAGPFRDVYEALEFRLPSPPLPLREATPAARIAVPLRLARDASNAAPELWVIHNGALTQLERLVRHANDRLIARLAFAATEVDGQPVVVVRARPARGAPPVLVLDAAEYRPFLRLPNLFLPVDARLHPPLRRDAVAALLAPDPGRVTWLARGDDGAFEPRSLPDEAFQPLSEWVDYVLDRDHQALAAWVRSAQFDFAAFACAEDVEDAEPVAPRRGRSRTGEPTRAAGTPAPTQPEAAGTPEAGDRFRAELAVEALPTVEPGAEARRLGAIERQFLALDAPPDAAERVPLWREMATLNAALGRSADSTVCWANAVWEQPHPDGATLTAWASTEARAAGTPIDEPDLAAIDRVLATPTATGPALRRLAVALARLAQGDQSLSGRVGRLQQVWEGHERLVPTRVAWLGWVALARLAGDDALMLARARDRVLERLHEQGLDRAVDLPGFLRQGATPSGERARVVGDHLQALHPASAAWIARDLFNARDTQPIADLIFAFGLARLGSAEVANRLLGEGLAGLDRRDAVASWAARAFGWRVRQTLAARPPTEPLPTDLISALETLDRVQRYKVDRLREHSSLLEPHERINPYRHWHGKLADDVVRELARVVDVTDRAELAERLARLLAVRAEGHKAALQDARVLGTALEVGYRLGETFAAGVLDRVLPTVARLDDVAPRASLLERGLRLAAHFDRAGHVQGFVGALVGLVERSGAGPGTTAAAIEPALRQSCRGLRKLGMRDEVARLLDRTAAAILGDDPVADPVARSGVRSQGHGRRLRLLLHVASGWFESGRTDAALPILDEARATLFEGDLIAVDQTGLACGYVRALGLTPSGTAVPRIAEVFDRLDRVADTFTTNSHYSLSKLDLIEAVVTTLSSDEFVLDEAGRRWLADDEFLVRRRIHRDVRHALGTTP